MQPTIGRIVHVPADPAKNNGASVAPAIITRVWSDTCVNLRVLLDSPETEWRTSVTFVEDLNGAELRTPWAWTWPPRV